MGLDRVIELSDSVRRISLRRQSLVIDTSDGANHEIPIEDLLMVLLDSQRTVLTSALLAKLGESGIPLVCTNGKHLPSSVLLPLAENQRAAKRQRLQAELKLPLKKRLWKQIVQHKILMQESVLVKQCAISNSLIGFVSKVRSGDVSNVEAQAAKRYWSLLFGDENYRRGSETDERNAALNYGYAVIRASTARAVCAGGLSGIFSLHHSNQYNPHALADDLMEPFRACVDQVVLRLSRERELTYGITRDVKEHLLGIIHEKVKIKGRWTTLPSAIGEVVDSLVSIVEGQGRELVLPEKCYGY